jgi:peptidoglycan/xylan/chitin deacetylase (PgdA/CDA1 family)/uncharacterized protein YgiM (DUF1202 family)
LQKIFSGDFHFLYTIPMRRTLTITLTALLLASCGSTEEFEDTFTFTETDVEEISALLDRIENEEGVTEEGQVLDSSLVVEEEVVIDASAAHRYDRLRSELGSLEENTYRVTNVFLNVRENPSVHATLITELSQGDHVRVLEFPTARWAKIKLPDERVGFVSSQYIARVVSDSQLEEIRRQYEGQYEVNFQFLNVRSEPASHGLKLGELSAHQIVTPSEIKDGWATIEFDGQQGFVSAEYLKPYLPKLIVRQERFAIPILRYRGDEPGAADALVQHIAFLKAEGKKIMTLRTFYDLLLAQEERDARIPEDRVLLLISDVTETTIKDIADALRASAVAATFFLQTSAIGAEGIAPQHVSMLSANGNDVQSASHNGDDLRALTNTQILNDLARSKQMIEEITGQDVFAVAYPGGGVNDRVADQAITAGYLFGVTLNPAVGEAFDRSQFLRLPSNVITSSTTEGTLRSLLGN